MIKIIPNASHQHLLALSVPQRPYQDVCQMTNVKLLVVCTGSGVTGRNLCATKKRTEHSHRKTATTNASVHSMPSVISLPTLARPVTRKPHLIALKQSNIAM